MNTSNDGNVNIALLIFVLSVRISIGILNIPVTKDIYIASLIAKQTNVFDIATIVCITFCFLNLYKIIPKTNKLNIVCIPKLIGNILINKTIITKNIDFFITSSNFKSKSNSI
jgi:hypothetical protein